MEEEEARAAKLANEICPAWGSQCMGEARGISPSLVGVVGVVALSGAAAAVILCQYAECAMQCNELEGEEEAEMPLHCTVYYTQTIACCCCCCCCFSGGSGEFSLFLPSASTRKNSTGA